MIDTPSWSDNAASTIQQEVDKANGTDERNEKDERNEQLLCESIRKVREFANQAFNGDTPRDVQERIDLLSQRISLSSAELSSIQKDAGIEAGIARHTRGLFVTKEDLVILPDNATENEIIHEALHFISHRPVTGTGSARQGLRSDTHGIRSDVYLDEGVTTLLSLMITLDIPINDRNAALNAYFNIQETKRHNELPITDSYRNAVDQIFLKIFAIDINNFNQDEINKRLSLLPAIARGYLSASPEKLWATIDSNAKTKIWQTPTSESLRKTVAEPTPERKKAVKAFISSDAMMLEKYAFLTGNYLTNANHFFDSIRSGKVTYVFPEEMAKLIEYNPGIKTGGLNLVPELCVSTDLHRNICNTPIGSLFLGKPVQRAALYLWQGYKIAHSNQKHLIQDEDFFKEPIIQQFLARQPSDQDRADIVRMALGVLHIAKSETDEEVISTMTTKQRIKKVTKTLGY